jgi:phosphate transport system protein
MLKQALDAYSLKNPETAKTVLYYEKEENLLKTQMVNCIIELLQKEKECTKQLVDLILIAKNLEKIGDHATNIAEDVIFMTLGADIRHAIASPIPS